MELNLLQGLGLCLGILGMPLVFCCETISCYINAEKTTIAMIGLIQGLIAVVAVLFL